MGWIIAFVILFLLAIFPLGVSVIYDADGFRLRIVAAFLKFQILPGKKKDPDKPEKPKKPKKEKSKKEKTKQQSKEKKPAEKKKGGSISDFFPFVSLALDLLLDFRDSLRFDYVKFKLILAGGDPADLAINYGNISVLVGNLWPRLEHWFVIKKRDVEVECDFEGSSTTVICRVDLTITIGRVVALVVRYAIRGLKEYFNFRKKRQGGTTV